MRPVSSNEMPRAGRRRPRCRRRGESSRRAGSRRREARRAGCGRGSARAASARCPLAPFVPLTARLAPGREWSLAVLDAGGAAALAFRAGDRGGAPARPRRSSALPVLPIPDSPTSTAPEFIGEPAIPAPRPRSRAPRDTRSWRPNGRLEPPQRRLPDRHLPLARAARGRDQLRLGAASSASAPRSRSTHRAGWSRSASGSTSRCWRCSTRRRSSRSATLDAAARASPAGGQPVHRLLGRRLLLPRQSRPGRRADDHPPRLRARQTDGARVRAGRATTTSRPSWPRGDKIISALPDWRGRLWFATRDGVIGWVGRRSGTVHARDLGEPIGNSFMVDEPGSVYIVTDGALYRLRARRGRGPHGLAQHGYGTSARSSPGRRRRARGRRRR